MDSPSVSDSSPAAGANFTLSAEVRNDGNGALPATTLRYYRSMGAMIKASDKAGGHGHGVGACRFGEQRGVDLADDDLVSRNLLRRVCGRSNGMNPQLDEQLLGVRAGLCTAGVCGEDGSGAKFG